MHGGIEKNFFDYSWFCEGKSGIISRNCADRFSSHIYVIFQRLRVFDDGYYIRFHEEDEEAKNLIDLLDLNNDSLARDRKNDIKRLKDLEIELGRERLLNHLENHPEQIYFRRALENEFEISFSKEGNIIF